MKKSRFLLLLVLAAALFIGMSMAAFAAVSAPLDSASPNASSPSAVSDIQPYENSLLNNEAQADAREISGTEGTLYAADNTIPQTGMESLLIPGMAALLAASTAAVVLTGRNKNK